MCWGLWSSSVVTINGKVHGKVKLEDVKDIINYYKNLD